MKDKIIIWIYNSLFYFPLAKAIKDNYDCDLFALVDITDRPKVFFEQQSFVKFQKIWYYHDHITKNNTKPDLKYLEYFEQKYKINLWTLAYNDRIFFEHNEYHKFTTDEVLSIITDECKLFESMLDEVNPDFIIMETPFLNHSYLFYLICKQRGINLLILRYARIGYKCFISNEDEAVDYKVKSSKVVNNRTFEELQNYQKQFDLYTQAVTDWKSKFANSKLAMLTAAMQYFLFSDNSNVRTHYTYYGRTKLRVLIKSILYSLRTRYRKSFVDKHLTRELADNDKFIFFPLHLEMEYALLILAPFYTNQIEVIKNIVKSLPIGYKLYVKENPLMHVRGWRSISDYKKIMNLPNVVLLHPTVNPKEIVKRSSLVISISGTTSFDAGFYGKPSIVFVDTVFSMVPWVHRLKGVEELPKSIRLSLNKEVKASDVDDYVNFIDEISFKFDYVGIIQNLQDFFHYGGFLVDVDISMEKMKKYLDLSKSEYEQLALEHIKKIKQYKEAKFRSS